MRASKVAAVLTILAAIPLAAQQTRSVSGTVKDGDGHPLAGAVVRMINMNAEHDVHSAVTRPDGTYRFPAVRFAESYTLQAKFRDYSGNVRHLSEYDWRASAVINLTVDTDRWRR
jgi:Carboxypeptidase regulatory-like domain